MVHISNPSKDHYYGLPESTDSEGRGDQANPPLQTKVQRPGTGRLEVKAISAPIELNPSPTWKVALFSYGNRITTWVPSKCTFDGEPYEAFFKGSDLVGDGMVHRAILWDSYTFMEILEMDVPCVVNPLTTSSISFNFHRSSND